MLAVPVAVIGGALPASAGTTHAVAGTGYFFGAACPSGRTCVAVGRNSSGWQAVVVTITGGIPGSVREVPGTEALYGVACPGVSTCVAVGQDTSGQGVVVPISNGAPGSAQVVPGSTLLTAVACSDTTSCQAVGYSTGIRQAMVVPISNGTAGTAQVVPGVVYLGGVACPNATTCEAVGVNSYSSAQGVVVPITNGLPGSAQLVPGAGALRGIACPDVSTCVAVGTPGVIAPITNGTPGSAQAVPGVTSFGGVACPSATSCEAVGMSPAGTGVAVPIRNGAPGSAQLVVGTHNLYGVACPTVSTCEVVGNQASPGTTGVVVSVAIQTVVSLTFDNGAISQYILGYQKALAPHGVKATFYINSGITGGANHMSWSQLSALASAGNEIGGKTVHGTNLTTLSTSQQIAEICNDRQAITSHGLKPVGFAYPAGAFNTTIQAEVRDCGYSTARTAGSISLAGPTYAETLPPNNWLALRAHAPTGHVTLANLEQLVTGAAAHGNGWIPIVIQKVCSQTLDPDRYATCTSSSGWVDLADLNTFLSWVQNAGQASGAPAGTVFDTIGNTANSLGLPSQ